MRILIDTNIIINREENIVVNSELQKLLEIISHLNYQILVHPFSVNELSEDIDKKRREINLSKIGTYPKLEQPPVLTSNSSFFSRLHVSDYKKEKDRVDNNLLFCVDKKAVHFLITEDKKMITKAKKLGISDKVLNIKDTLNKFKKIPIPHKIMLTTTPAIQEVPVFSLNLDEPFFDSLKKDYGEKEFVQWWERISQEGRKAWVYNTEKGLGAILIYKYENESIPSTPPLPKKERIKICTLKVEHMGYKIGELLIKLTISYAVKINVDEIYLTHYVGEKGRLKRLIEEYGFYRVAKKIDDEDIFIKNIIPNALCGLPIEVQKRFYPSFYDGGQVRKFIVPIKPDFHDRLFTDYDKRQPKLYEFAGELIVEGNTIKKAYICHSNTKKIQTGDLLLFYRSIDKHKMTSIGVVEKAINDVMDPDRIEKEVGKRTVYKRKEIEDMAQGPTKIILFYHNFHLPKTIDLKTMLREKIIKGYPQSIQEITHDNYLKIIELSRFDKRFCIKNLKDK